MITTPDPTKIKLELMSNEIEAIRDELNDFSIGNKGYKIPEETRE